MEKRPIIDFSSFKTRIILTLILVTAIFSFVSFQVYSKYLSKKIYENAEENIKSLLHLLEGEIINVHDGRLIKPMLRNIEKDPRIIGAYLLDSNGRFLMPNRTEKEIRDTLEFREFIQSGEEVAITTFRHTRVPYSRAMLHVTNMPACYECHSPDEKTLGYVALDFSMEETRNTLVFTRNFSILFTAFMVLIIIVFVLVMHYRFIRKSLAQFNKVILNVNKGKLDSRVDIPSSRELSSLGMSFNKMLDTFQHTQKELSLYHIREMKDAEKMVAIGEMAARLAHEVRNPLTGIANSIEIIAGELKDSPNGAILEEVQRQANRVNTAISNLLKYSRSTEVHMETDHLNEMVASLLFFLRNQAQNREVDFEFYPDLAIPPFQFDREQLENVLLNLCLNAVQAMDKKGRVIISTTFDGPGGQVFIHVEDTGPGIPTPYADEVFKPFFTTRTEGTGLGLAICKDIVEKHGGKIWFEATTSKGTLFHIAMPCLRPVGP